jgi:hypothetical protein
MAMKKRNKFNLSNYKLLTASMGQLIPIGMYEVLPGDTVQQNSSLFIRMAAMATPVMHPLHVRIHHWYVPFRLIWDDFESFITGGEDGLDTTAPPTTGSYNAMGFLAGTLGDYLGVPIDKLCPFPSETTGDWPGISALPFRAYGLIYNEWYRDQDLEDPVRVNTASGAEVRAECTNQNLLRADWERDYFTTARPWPQKGAAVTVPITGGGVTGNVIPDPDVDHPTFTAHRTVGPTGTDGSGALGHYFENEEGGTLINRLSGPSSSPIPYLGSFTDVYRWGNPGLKLSGGSLGALDINALREAFALQKFEEHRAMYGSRYTEYLRYLGVRASDSRLQRPEYLGGGKSTIQFSEVLQTAAGQSPFPNGPVGKLAGHGIGAMRTNRFRRFFEEHGIVMTLLSAVPKAIYMNALPRLWTRRTKEDYWQKELEHIGQQEVYTDEIRYKGPWMPGVPRVTFGYQNRYDDYREIQSSVSGEFRKTEKYWHLAREFSNDPVLNADFITCNPSARIFADPGTESRQAQQMYIMANHSIQARRLLSRNGNPI